MSLHRSCLLIFILFFNLQCRERSVSKTASQNQINFEEIKLDIFVHGEIYSEKQVISRDLNNDKLPDLIFIPEREGDPQVFLQEKDFKFSKSDSFSKKLKLLDENTILHTVDINNDGYLDLLTRDRGNYSDLILYKGKSDGLFEFYDRITSTIDFPISVTSGDYNGDKKIDLAVVNNSNCSKNDPIVLLLGNGDGTFKGGIFGRDTFGIYNQLSSFYRKTTYEQSQLLFWHGIKPPPSTLGKCTPNAEYLDSGDFDGDGYSDLYVSASQLHYGYIFWGGKNPFQSVQNILATAHYNGKSWGYRDYTKTADINGDGVDDILTIFLKYGSTFQLGVFYGSKERLFDYSQNESDGINSVKNPKDMAYLDPYRYDNRSESLGSTSRKRLSSTSNIQVHNFDNDSDKEVILNYDGGKIMLLDHYLKPTPKKFAKYLRLAEKSGLEGVEGVSVVVDLNNNGVSDILQIERVGSGYREKNVVRVLIK